jgi:hypothetical protein
MKKLLLVISGAMIPVVLAGGTYIYIKHTMPEDIWSEKNRNLLYESFSPQKTYKIGVYNYDEGALGYTSVQVSVARANEKYPLTGNLLTNQYVDSVNWLAEDKAELNFPAKARWHTKLTVTAD